MVNMIFQTQRCYQILQKKISFNCLGSAQKIIGVEVKKAKYVTHPNAILC